MGQKMAHLSRMDIAPLAVGIFGAIVVGRMLFNGSASADGQGLRREDQPFLYWAIVLAGVAVVGFLFYLAISG